MVEEVQSKVYLAKQLQFIIIAVVSLRAIFSMYGSTQYSYIAIINALSELHIDAHIKMSMCTLAGVYNS